MPVSELDVVERIARVLAASRFSINAEGDKPSVSTEVDSQWPAYRDEAIAVLKTLREPDRAMADAGDAAVWTKMVDTALTNQVSPRTD